MTEESFNAFIEKLPIAVACFDEHRRYRALNEVCALVNGKSRELTIGRTIEEVVPGLVDSITPFFNKVYLENESVENVLIEGTTPAADQKRFWLASYQPLPLLDGKRGLLVTAEEITQQVFANRSAETNKRLLTDVLNSLFTFVALLDNKGVLLDANQAPLTVAGIDITDVQGRDFWDCYWWNYSDRTQARIRKAVVNAQNGESVRFDIDARVADGFLTVDFMVEGLTDDAGKLTHIIASAIDITERKRTEEQLRLSQSRFETMINRTVDGLVAFDQRGIIQFANRRFEELTDNTLHIGKTSFYSYISDPHIKSRIDELIEYVLSNGIHQAIKRRSQALVQDVCVLLPNLLPVEMALAPMLDGKDVLYLATISDVSALYSANQALEKTLNDKTVLLNEVHHRVKNNLQVMSSLLNLQANSDNTDSKTREALLDSQRRLKSMALIHELLYEREDFTHANLQLFARKLLQLLQDSMTNGNHIKIKKEFADTNLYLVLEQLVPFGFLITELITNAFKHAFVNDAQPSPMIIVRIAQVGEEVEVTIEDNGVGLPAHPHALKTSLGSELMKIFAKQLKAELTTTSDAGVTHKIRF